MSITVRLIPPPALTLQVFAQLRALVDVQVSVSLVAAEVKVEKLG